MLSSKFKIKPTPAQDLKPGMYVNLVEYGKQPLKVVEVKKFSDAVKVQFDQADDVFLNDTVLNVVTNYKPGRP
jgi:hypothetical protein